MNTAAIEKIKAKIRPILKKRQVALAYLFGSYAHGNIGPLSDIDVAVVFSEDVPVDEQFDLVLRLMGDISQALQISNVDVVNLKAVNDPLIKYNAVLNGKLIFRKDGTDYFQLAQSILREYEDTNYLREMSSRILHQHIKDGLYGTASIYAASK